MEDNGIGKIDITILNLYPFEATVAKGAAFEECIENIDIGGPSMLRSTAKSQEPRIMHSLPLLRALISMMRSKLPSKNMEVPPWP